MDVSGFHEVFELGSYQFEETYGLDVIKLFDVVWRGNFSANGLCKIEKSDRVLSYPSNGPSFPLAE